MGNKCTMAQSCKTSALSTRIKDVFKFPCGLIKNNCSSALLKSDAYDNYDDRGQVRMVSSRLLMLSMAQMSRKLATETIQTCLGRKPRNWHTTILSHLDCRETSKLLLSVCHSKVLLKYREQNEAEFTRIHIFKSYAD